MAPDDVKFVEVSIDGLGLGLLDFYYGCSMQASDGFPIFSRTPTSENVQHVFVGQGIAHTIMLPVASCDISVLFESPRCKTCIDFIDVNRF